MESEIKDYCEKVYNTKKPDEVSWTQEKPETSLNFIFSFLSTPLIHKQD